MLTGSGQERRIRPMARARVRHIAVAAERIISMLSVGADNRQQGE